MQIKDDTNTHALLLYPEMNKSSLLWLLFMNELFRPSVNLLPPLTCQKQSELPHMSLKNIV